MAENISIYFAGASHTYTYTFTIKTELDFWCGRKYTVHRDRLCISLILDMILFGIWLDRVVELENRMQKQILGLETKRILLWFSFYSFLIYRNAILWGSVCVCDSTKSSVLTDVISAIKTLLCLGPFLVKPRLFCSFQFDIMQNRLHKKSVKSLMAIFILVKAKMKITANALRLRRNYITIKPLQFCIYSRDNDERR